ncbi:MAG TPA: ubiquinol oxidase subunit II [Candidatus Saccharimonadia bacterium]|nr:ubiquinol oxidase subunit II [Candidatus Saccharimonadia bacterium]
MKGRYKVALVMLVAAIGISVLASIMHGHTIAVLDPKGPVARQEMNLMVLAVSLMLIVVLPVFALTIGIAWRYRATNTKAKYTPDWDRKRSLEILWWIVPAAIVSVLAVVTWVSTHALDPYKPLSSKVPQMTIQVVAMDWKWLFIYPSAHIATVNFVEFPKGTPVDFNITSDAPMNSFWVPQLGGQIYAMPGMSTQLHLLADGSGSYNGMSANISGRGFSGMLFVAKSVTNPQYKDWLTQVRRTNHPLNAQAYANLAAPSTYNPHAYYSSVESGLYDDIIMKYMMPGAANPDVYTPPTPAGLNMNMGSMSK